MSIFTQAEAKLRATDDRKIVRSWNNNPILRDTRGDVVGENPAYHATICQKENGSYCTPTGKAIPRSEIPQHVLDCGRPEPYRPRANVDMTFEEFERSSVEKDEAVPPPMPAKRKVGRPRKAA
jgi:hypothetical protein